MELATLLPPLAGGLLIGLATSLLLWSNGRLAGVSGAFADLLMPSKAGTSWQGTFLSGLLAGGALVALARPEAYGPMVASTPVLALAGLLVGFGTRLGNGCTSGHGVCGNSRLSPRSLIATVTFIASGALVVLLLRVFGGAA